MKGLTYFYFYAIINPKIKDGRGRENKVKQKIKEELKAMQDSKYKEFQSGLCPGTNNMIGIRVPVLRNYAKELLKENSLEELLRNIDDEYYEEIMLQGMLIGLAKPKEKEIIFQAIQEFIPKIDNWAVCDIFCGGLKITKKHKEEMWNFLQSYITSDKEFEIRFAVVMLLSYYIEEDYIEKDFAIFDRIQNDAYYVQMAVAWAISLCLIQFYDKTMEYLQHCRLDKFTFNKAIQKAIESFRITKEQKEELRKMKRK